MSSRIRLAVTQMTTLAALVAAAPAQQQLSGPTGVLGFGNRVSVHGVRAVTSQLPTFNGVHTVDLEDGAWDISFSQLNGVDGDNAFASSLAAFEGGFAVSNPLEDIGAEVDAGVVFIYGDDQQVLQTLQDPFGLAGGEQFGAAVASTSDGRWLAIGAPFDDVPFDTGAVHVYERRADGSYVHVQRVEAPQGVVGRIGTAHRSISISDNLLVIGNPEDAGPTGQGINQGAAYVYERQGSTWLFTQTVYSGDPGDEELFGGRVTNSDSVLAIAELEDRTLPQTVSNIDGVVFIFREGATGWTQTQRLFQGAASGFGQSLDIDGNQLVVGAPKFEVVIPLAGAAFLYQDRGGVFTLEGRMDSPAPTLFHQFGFDVAIHQGRIAVGEPYFAGNIGSVWFFDTAEAISSPYCPQAVQNSAGAFAEVSMFGSDNVLDDDLTARMSGLPARTSVLLIASVDAGATANPAGSLGTLCLAGSIGRFTNILTASAMGTADLAVDLDAIPQGGGFAMIQPGETWNFQGWYRDVANGQPVSNFTGAVSVTFQ